MVAPLLLLSVFWSLVDCQPAAPYITFYDSTLSNHAFVNLRTVGDPDARRNDGVTCLTDKNTTDGHRGDWYFPDGSRLQFSNGDDDVYQQRVSRGVDLRLRSTTGDRSSGIYRCDIPTEAIHDDGNWMVRASIYVGIYYKGGDVNISDVDVTTDFNGISPQFTLTCISIGGPATTVTWTRDSVTVTEGTETVLDDPVTAQYTHTLTVTGTLEGLYTCTVSNCKPSKDSAQFNVQASSPVEGFVPTNSSSTSLSFSWIPPNVVAALVTGYSLSCSPLLEGIPTPEPLMLGPRVTLATVTGLYQGVSYSCNITTIGPLGTSQPLIVNHSTSEIAPTGVPELFTAVAGQRQVDFSWSPPQMTLCNGVIISYTLSCSPSPSSLPQSPSQSGPLTVAGFSPDTSYSCSLVATNNQGSGPPANMSFTTQEDYSYFQLRLDGAVTCSGLSNGEKLEDITRAVLEGLSNSCTGCAIPNGIIDKQSFIFPSDSSAYVTYRARLEGTSETDSGSLISLIEEWVSSGPSIIVSTILLRVDQECSVPLSSPSEGECEYSSATSTANPLPGSNSRDNIGAIIGGVVAIILIISITLIAISIAALVIVKYYISAGTVKAEEDVVTEVQGRNHSTTTIRNTNYDYVDYRSDGRYTVVTDPPEDSGSDTKPTSIRPDEADIVEEVEGLYEQIPGNVM